METRAQKATKDKPDEFESEEQQTDEMDELLIELPPQDKPKRKRKKYKQFFTEEQKERMKAYKKRYWATLTDELKEKNRIRCRERYANLPHEEKEKKRAYLRAYRDTDEQRKKYNARLKGSYAKLSEEQKEKSRAYRRQLRTMATEEQREKNRIRKRESYARLHQNTLVIEVPACNDSPGLTQGKINNSTGGSSDIIDKSESIKKECTPQTGETDHFVETEDWTRRIVKTESDVDETMRVKTECDVDE